MKSLEDIAEFFSSYDRKLLPIEQIYLAIAKDLLGEKKQSLALLNAVAKISTSWEKRVHIVKNQLV